MPSHRHELAQAPRVIALGLTQTVAWAASTYLPAVIAAPLASDLGVRTSLVFAAVSWSLPYRWSRWPHFSR
jgi:hypothetical protein